MILFLYALQRANTKLLTTPLQEKFQILGYLKRWVFLGYFLGTVLVYHSKDLAVYHLRKTQLVEMDWIS